MGLNVIQFPTRPPDEAVFLNQSEDLFTRTAFAKGWAVTKRGWPDFLCQSRSGEWFCVEIKRRTKSGRLAHLRPEQVACLDWLSSLGVRCYVSDGVTFERYAENHRRGLPRYIAALRAFNRDMPRTEESARPTGQPLGDPQSLAAAVESNSLVPASTVNLVPLPVE